jgi:hypothetical protein
VPVVPAFELGAAGGGVTRAVGRLWTQGAGEVPLHLSARDGDHLVTETEVAEATAEVAGSFRHLPPDGVPLRFAVVSWAKDDPGFCNAHKAVAARDDLHLVPASCDRWSLEAAAHSGGAQVRRTANLTLAA